MKKNLALIAAVTMLAAFTGCNKTEEPAADAVTDASVSEAAAENTEAAETEAETAAETTAAEETKAADPADMQSVLDSKGDKIWTVDLINNLNSWTDGNTVINIRAEEEDVEVIMTLNTYGDKLYMLTEITGMFKMTAVSDGANTYMIDDATSTYSIEATEADTSDFDAYVPNEDAAEGYVSSGIEEINGTEYIYEEFTVEDEDNNIRYYYDADSNVIGIGQDDEDGKKIFASFTVDFCTEPDESVFEVPADYTEITSEEMAVNMFAGLLEAIPAE